METGLTAADICKLAVQLDDCDAKTFLSNFEQWFSILVIPIEKLAKDGGGSTKSPSSTIIPRAAVAALCHLLSSAVEFPTITKDLNTLKIHRLVQALIQCPPWFDQWSLLGINCCLQYFRDGCKKNFSKTIVPFASRCLNSPEEKVRKRAAYTVAVFPLMAGNTVRSEIWNQQLNSVLANLHGTIVQLSEPLVTHNESCQAPIPTKQKKKHSEGGETVLFFNQLFENDGKSNVSVQSMEGRIQFLIDVMRLMVCECEGFVVAINLQVFVDMFLCILDIIEKLKTPKRFFYDLVSEFSIFIGEKLLPTVGIMAAPFALSFVDGAIRLLRHCRSDTYSVVESGFVLLAAVAKHIGPASMASYQRVASKALEYTDHLLLSDSTASEDSESLNAVASDSTKRKAQKRKAILMEEMSADQSIIRTRSGSMSQRVAAAKACLRMWTSIVESGGGFMKSNDFRRLQQFICRQLLRLQTEGGYAENRNGSIATLRKELYNVLTSLIACPHPSRPSALQCAIRIFENGSRRESDQDVITACRNGLAICSLMAKPRVPCLESVLVEEEKEDDSVEGKVTSQVDWRSQESSSGIGMLCLPSAGDTAVSSAIPKEELIPPAPQLVRESYNTDERSRVSVAPKVMDGRTDDVGDKRDTAVVTIEDEESSSDNDSVTCIDQAGVGKMEFSKEKAHTEESDKELNAMFGDFVDEPAEATDIYID